MCHFIRFPCVESFSLSLHLLQVNFLLNNVPFTWMCSWPYRMEKSSKRILPLIPLSIKGATITLNIKSLCTSNLELKGQWYLIIWTWLTFGQIYAFMNFIISTLIKSIWHAINYRGFYLIQSHGKMWINPLSYFPIMACDIWI